jgi:hypothetical protein
MATALDPKQIVLLVEKGISTKEEFLTMVNVVNLEIAKMV